MTDVQEVTQKPNRAKKKAKTKAAKPLVVPKEFAGITAAECCDACFEKGACIISGSICAHPNKGGLQAGIMNDRPAIAKFQRAKKVLEHQLIDLRATA